MTLIKIKYMTSHIYVTFVECGQECGMHRDQGRASWGPNQGEGETNMSNTIHENK